MLVAVEISEDFTVALKSAQDETIGRLQSLLQRLSRRDNPSPRASTESQLHAPSDLDSSEAEA
jgi:hypothetical protein